MRGFLAVGMIVMLLVPAVAVSGHYGIGGISLKPQPSARAVAMGETGLVLVPDGSGFMVNPASLPWTFAPGFTVGYGGLVEGIPASTASLAAVLPFGDPVEIPGPEEVGRRFGLGVSLDRTGVELSQGTDWAQSMISVGIGCLPAPFASVGLACKYLVSSSDLEGADVKAYAADVGAFVELSSRVAVGLSVKNVLGVARWDNGEDESPPVLVGLGTGVALPYRASGNLAVTLSNSDPAKGGIGVEVPIAATGFDLRAGFLSHFGDHSRTILTTGFGLRYARFRLDYAVKLDDEVALGTTHHVSLCFMLP
jgi:hypothetical protein